MVQNRGGKGVNVVKQGSGFGKVVQGRRFIRVGCMVCEDSVDAG